MASCSEASDDRKDACCLQRSSPIGGCRRIMSPVAARALRVPAIHLHCESCRSAGKFPCGSLAVRVSFRCITDMQAAPRSAVMVNVCLHLLSVMSIHYKTARRSRTITMRAWPSAASQYERNGSHRWLYPQPHENVPRLRKNELARPANVALAASAEVSAALASSGTLRVRVKF